MLGAFQFRVLGANIMQVLLFIGFSILEFAHPVNLQTRMHLAKQQRQKHCHPSSVSWQLGIPRHQLIKKIMYSMSTYGVT